jgi:hypothetical protein
MIYYYIKSFLRSIRKNFFFHSINLTGFFAGIFLLTIIFTFIYQELSLTGFTKINLLYTAFNPVDMELLRCVLEKRSGIKFRR